MPLYYKQEIPRKIKRKSPTFIPFSEAKFLRQFQTVAKSSSVTLLEKAQNTSGGQVSLRDITEALDEFTKLFDSGFASKGEILTLARAFPDNILYTEAAAHIPSKDVMVVGGPASVSLIDREGHLITPEALGSAFQKIHG